ncbi:MAG: C40 family peptidase [Gammaproteobacteria bacterium]|jgi:cell wall-associated NlpC family hydrolase
MVNIKPPVLLLTLAIAAGLGGCAGTPTRPATHDWRDAGYPVTPKRQEVVHVAKSMLGHRYLYGGDTPREGFDCSGLVFYSYERAGINVPRTAYQQLKHSRKVGFYDLRPGDLLFFQFHGRPSHVGIYIGDGSFIHAPKTGGRVSRASLENPYWSEHLVRAGNYF